MIRRIEAGRRQEATTAEREDAGQALDELQAAISARMLARGEEIHRETLPPKITSITFLKMTCSEQKDYAKRLASWQGRPDLLSFVNSLSCLLNAATRQMHGKLSLFRCQFYQSNSELRAFS